MRYPFGLHACGIECADVYTVCKAARHTIGNQCQAICLFCCTHHIWLVKMNGPKPYLLLVTGTCRAVYGCGMIVPSVHQQLSVAASMPHIRAYSMDINVFLPLVGHVAVPDTSYDRMAGWTTVVFSRALVAFIIIGQYNKHNIEMCPFPLHKRVCLQGSLFPEWSMECRSLQLW